MPLPYKDIELKPESLPEDQQRVLVTHRITGITHRCIYCSQENVFKENSTSRTFIPYTHIDQWIEV